MIKTYTKADQAIEITNEIHDCSFDVDNIIYNESQKILSIQFEKKILDNVLTVKKILFLKIKKTPVHKCLLKIYDVKKYDIRDNAQIGRYDFNEIQIDEGNGIVLITSGFPLEIKISINKVNIALEITDEVIDEKVSTDLFK